jgi:glycosyltransferase involved in cell wall biosynthesis
MNSKVLWVRESFPHMGQHSGYDYLCTTLEKQQPDRYHSVRRDRNKTPRGIGRLLAKQMVSCSSNPMYDSSSAWAEVKAMGKAYLQKIQQIHLLYVEDHFRIIAKQRNRLSARMLATAHQPSGWWRSIHGCPEELQGLDHLLVLSSREVEYFDKYLPGRVSFIPHGVDTDFFYPKEQLAASDDSTAGFSCIFVGQWLRDLETLVAVIDHVLARNSNIYFNLVIPIFKRNVPCLQRVARHTQVRWYANLTDEGLRDLYQKSDALVLPLLDCTANNALLEAMACGLPIISNQVGGLADYTQPNFAHLLPVGDVVGMADAILAIATDRQACKRQGLEARKSVMASFSWDNIATQVAEIYNS